ncbi:MAG: hypothetical protein WKF43_04370 [Acidimicrobiales bacterium]
MSIRSAALAIALIVRVASWTPECEQGRYQLARLTFRAPSAEQPRPIDSGRPA